MTKINFKKGDEAFLDLAQKNLDAEWDDISDNTVAEAAYRANIGRIDHVDFGRTILKNAALLLVGSSIKNANKKARILLEAAKNDDVDPDNITIPKILKNDIIGNHTYDEAEFAKRTGQALLIMAFTTPSYPAYMTHKEWIKALKKHGKTLLLYGHAREKNHLVDDTQKRNKKAQKSMVWIAEHWQTIWI